jgi:para-aminobenzoate synthetase component 1
LLVAEVEVHGSIVGSVPVEAFAHVGGRLARELVDVTTDLGALDSSGFWAVVLPFDGQPMCARFASVSVEPVPLPVSPWRGPPASGWSSSLDEGEWKEAVSSIRRSIAAGDVYQVNLCRVLSAALPASCGGVAGLGAALSAHHPAPYAGVVSVPSAGVAIASASPELFLRRVGHEVWSSPIKGTASSFDGFLPKDRAENVMIVDLVRNDLGRVCSPGTISVPSLCAVESHPGLHHLVSTVTGRMRAGEGWASLLDATFPPGSVTGAPKLAALSQIAALEPVSRGPYTGAVGWVDADAGVGELNVAIRTFWLAGDRIHFGTGGAITWDSTPQGEWEETELKARALLAVASGEPGESGVSS